MRSARILKWMIVASTFLAVPTLARHSSPSTDSSQFDGEWRVVWPCATMPQAWREACVAGTPNNFTLFLWSTNGKLCGTHMPVAHFGNKVDETEDWSPSIVGNLSGHEIIVQFHSHWGADGHARLTLKHGELHWKLLDVSSDEHWLPSQAALHRISASAAKKKRHEVDAPPPCTGVLNSDG